MAATSSDTPQESRARKPEPRLDDHEVETLLARMAAGDTQASEQLFPVVYRELHRIAHLLMSGERRGHTLQTTALVHEAWLRLRPTTSQTPETRVRFMGLAARAMRRVLVDHARRRAAKKRRAGDRRELLDDVLADWNVGGADLLELDDALDKLGEEDPQLKDLVELRFYGGLSLEEIAAALGLSVRQVRRRWTLARGWLRLRLTGEDGSA